MLNQIRDMVSPFRRNVYRKKKPGEYPLMQIWKKPGEDVAPSGCPQYRPERAKGNGGRKV